MNNPKDSLEGGLAAALPLPITDPYGVKPKASFFYRLPENLDWVRLFQRPSAVQGV